MHRSIEVAAPAAEIQNIINALETHTQVISMTRISGGSVKPAGDTLRLEVLNRGADDVLELIEKNVKGSFYSLSTKEMASLTSPPQQKAINNDVDEAIWEELESGLRHNGCITPNFLLLMALGGVIAAIGFVSFLQMQVVAFIAASIIAPGLEPIAKLPLGIVMGKREIAVQGLKSTLAGYGVLMASAAATFALLYGVGEAKDYDFLSNEVTKSLLHVKLMDIIMSLAAAAASIIMYLSYRRNVIAGPLIALILIPATTAAAIFAVLGKWGEAGTVLAKSALEVGIIVSVGVLLIWAKQKWVHRRKPIR